jgi:predicted PurR-regulated permease PerM
VHIGKAFWPKKLIDTYIELSPLPNDYDKRILKSMAQSSESVLKGALIIALIQGCMGAIGSLIGGYSSPAIFGLATAIVSFLPGVGPGFILIPSILFKLATGHLVSGFFFLGWYLVGLAVVDNIISPHLLRRGGIAVHQFFILLGIIGGIVVFGPIGFVLGPLIMTFFFVLVELYPDIANKKVTFLSDPVHK